MVKILNTCILSILVYTNCTIYIIIFIFILFIHIIVYIPRNIYIQRNISIHRNISIKRYIGCLEIEIQIFKTDGYLIGRNNRLDTKPALWLSRTEYSVCAGSLVVS